MKKEKEAEAAEVEASRDARSRSSLTRVRQAARQALQAVKASLKSTAADDVAAARRAAMTFRQVESTAAVVMPVDHAAASSSRSANV